LQWFGKEYRTQVVANDGAHPLLGTMLLDGHDLAIRYQRRTVSLDWSRSLKAFHGKFSYATFK
jgi:hypothetical protein